MRKLTALLLAFAMVLSLTMPAVAAEDTQTIYFENAGKWSTVNAYAWDAESNAPLGTWPGSAMTKVEGEENIYSIEVPTDAVNVIFNNGSEQTGDLTIPTDGKNMYSFGSNSWSTYGSTGGITGGTSSDVTATFAPEIYVNGISITGDTVTYDPETNTYITVFPVGAESITHKTIYSGKNLAYYRDAGDRLKYREIGFKNGEQVGQWDTVLSEYNHFTYDEATGNLTVTGEPNAAIAGETWILSYSNDGGRTWQEACTQVYVQAYSITNSTAADANGSVTVPASAIEGETVTLTVTPEVGYELDELTVTYEDADGVTQNVIVTDNAFTMPAFAVTVTATFQQATETYTVTVDENIANGTVVVNPTTYTAGQTVTLAVNPDEGYTLTDLTVTNTATGEPVTVSENNTFVMPDGNVTVTATFKATYTITTSTTGDVGGSTISVPASAAEGDIVTVTLNPAEGYTPLNFRVVEDVNFFEVPFTKVNETTYTFVMPAQNVGIEVDFCLPGTTLDAIYYKGTWTNVRFEFTNSASNYAGEVKGTMKETGIYEAAPIPEWSYYLIIRNLDNEGESISWTRIPTDGRNMYNAETQQWETYTPSQPPEEVTSAEITWGSMSFTYTDGENGAKGAWSVDGTAEDAGTVTVKNTGTATVTVSAVYTPETAYAEITGTLGEEKTLAAAESGTFTLTLSGKPNKALNGEKIGTVTVTIE